MANIVASGIYAILILLMVAVIVAARVNSARGQKNSAFMYLSICIFGWLVSDLLILLIDNININTLIWNTASMTFVAITPIGIFLVVFQHFLPERKVPKSVIFALSIIPVITMVLAFTSNFHSLLRNVEHIIVWPRAVQYTMGAWFPIHTISGYVLMSSSYFIASLYFGLIKNTRNDRKMALVFFIAMNITLTGNMVYLLDILPSDINITSMSFATATIIFHIAMSDKRYGVTFRIFNTLRSRITFPVLFAMFAMVMTIIYFVSRDTRLMVEGFEGDRMASATRAVRTHLDSLEQQAVISASAMGNSSELIRLIDAYEAGYETRDAVRQYISGQAGHFGVDEITVSSAGGGSFSHMAESYDVSNEPFIVISSASPILDGDRLVGSVVVNFVVSNDVFLDNMQGIFDVDVIVYNQDGVAVASTLIHPSTGERTAGVGVHADAISAVLGRGQSMPVELYMFGNIPFAGYYFPLLDTEGNPNAMMFIGTSRAYALNVIGMQVRNVIASALIGGFSISFIMFLLIMKSTMPLTTLAANVKDVSAGNININIDRRTITPDEMGLLTKDVLDLVEVIKCILTDLEQFDREANTEGNVDFRLDSSQYKGAYREMLDAINKYADNFSSDVLMTISTLKQIADGEHGIQVPVLPGKKNNLSQSLKDLNEYHIAVYEAIMHIADNAAKGNFDVSVDASRFSGGWAEMIEGLNKFVSDVRKPLNELRSVMGKMSSALFDTKIEGDYSGAFLTIKNDVNGVIDSLRKYIHEIDDCLNDISDGDLTRRLSMQFDGEFNRIGESITHISTTLHKTMTGISLASSQVLAGAEQISASSADLADGTLEQASSVQELNATIEMINQQTRENTGKTVEATVLSRLSIVNVREGGDAMQEMLLAMAQIKESSGSIAKVIDVIQNIAFQTNLLALNASVEAARAGEHGKGFSVVAEEVRNLASRSKAAAEETSGLIQTSINRVESGERVASTASGSLDAIVKNADDVMAIISSISNASKEQSEAMEQIANGISHISKVVQDNSSVSAENAAVSEELTTQAELLQLLVAYFKL